MGRSHVPDQPRKGALDVPLGVKERQAVLEELAHRDRTAQGREGQLVGQSGAAAAAQSQLHHGGSAAPAACAAQAPVRVAWTETLAVRNKAQRWVFASLQEKLDAFPCAILGLDSDNGGEFINHPLVEFCTQHQLTFTRSRPERKNDNCYVGQKNLAVVRRTVGHRRYDTPEQLALFGELDTNLRLYRISPSRRGSSSARSATVRRCVASTTPPPRPTSAFSQRTGSPGPPKDRLTDLHLGLNPAALQREINRRQPQALLSLSSEPLPTPVKPRRGQAIEPHTP